MRGSSPWLLLLVGCGRILGFDDYEASDAGVADATLDAPRDAGTDAFDAGFDGGFDGGLDAFDASVEVLEQVALGTDHTCAMTNRQIYCWGSNEFGQLGIDTGGERVRTPTPIDLERETLGLGAQLVAGHNNTCVIASTGSVSCWGDGMQGQFGSGSAPPSFEPVEIGIEASEVTIGLESICAIERASTCGSNAVCWGNDGHGRLGRGTNGGVRNVGCVAGAIDLESIVGLDRHYCALEGAVPWCWGLNDLRQVRDNPSEAVLTANPAINTGAIPADIRQLAVGIAFSCALNTSDEVRCWGGGGQGQLGDGSMSQRATYPPAAIGFEGGRPIRQIAAGQAHVCALDADGRVHCWGQKGEGRLGRNDAVGQQLSPAVLTTLPTIESIATGDAHTCAISTANELWCWGRNREGQIGNGETTHALSPVNVSVVAF